MVLFLQLKRWTQKRRNLVKNTSSFSVEVGEQVVLPCFLQVRGLDVQWLAYRVMSFAVHTGASLWSGDYQAVLSGHRQLPDGTTGWYGMITDDNRDIQVCSSTFLQHAHHNNYLLGLCRDDS